MYAMRATSRIVPSVRASVKPTRIATAVSTRGMSQTTPKPLALRIEESVRGVLPKKRDFVAGIFAMYASIYGLYKLRKYLKTPESAEPATEEEDGEPADGDEEYEWSIPEDEAEEEKE